MINLFCSFIFLFVKRGSNLLCFIIAFARNMQIQLLCYAICPDLVAWDSQKSHPVFPGLPHGDTRPISNSFYLFICSSICLSVYLSINLSIYYLFLFIYLSSCPVVCLLVYAFDNLICAKGLHHVVCAETSIIPFPFLIG